MVPYRCPSCAHEGAFPAYAAGRRAICPECGKGFRLPGRRGQTTVLLPPPASLSPEELEATEELQLTEELEEAEELPADRPAYVSEVPASHRTMALGLLALLIVLALFVCGGAILLLVSRG
jgi:hypothetical protein